MARARSDHAKKIAWIAPREILAPAKLQIMFETRFCIMRWSLCRDDAFKARASIALAKTCFIMMKEHGRGFR
jgi:hypothetical protein